jgi:flagellar transcriptional activator FlhD
MLLPCFRFDDAQLARLMAGEGRDAASAGLHAAILAAGKAASEALRSPNEEQECDRGSG